MLAKLWVPSAEPLPQLGICTTPEADVNPCQLTTLQPFVPGTLLITPAGSATVTEQFGYPGSVWLWEPPGQYWSPAKAPAGEPVTLKTNWLLAGHAGAAVVVVVAAQLMSPFDVKPITNCPVGQD